MCKCSVYCTNDHIDACAVFTLFFLQLLLGTNNGKIRLYDTESKTTRFDVSTDSQYTRYEGRCAVCFDVRDISLHHSYQSCCPLMLELCRWLPVPLGLRLSALPRWTLSRQSHLHLGLLFPRTKKSIQRACYKERCCFGT